MRILLISLNILFLAVVVLLSIDVGLFSNRTATPDDVVVAANNPDPAYVQANRSVTVSEQENINIYSSRNLGVVNITTEVVAYNWFLEPIPQRGSTGSGSIIDQNGYVLTNYHVVENASQIYVTLADGERFESTLVGSDAENDLAVLKFNAPEKTLTVIPFGISHDLRIGMKVLAIGNPFGLDRTLTTGIISGLNRPVRITNSIIANNMIQTDASINPGNSGGPLLDIDGNMIGINTAIYSPSGGSIGIGFAVPIDIARRVVPDLINYGVVKRGWIDIVPRQLFPQLVQYADLSVNRGVLVSEVISGGNAAQAGIRGGDKQKGIRYGRTVIFLGGDIIVSVDNKSVTDIASFYGALENTRPGDTIPIMYIRNRTERSATITLSERPQEFQWE